MRLRYGTLLVSLLAGATAAAPVSPGHSLAGQQAAAADLMAASAPAAPAPLRGSVPAAFATAQEPTEQPSGFIGQADRVMGVVNGWIGAVLFFDLIFWSDTQTLPFIVLWLIVAGIYLTLRMGFINFRGFRHAIQLTRGKYTDPSEPGDVTHFQALSTALSATVGLGNIAGVAIAVTLGGPGATFWMIVAGFIGMSTKFTECTLGQMYREIRPDGHVLGGPVQYLSKGFAERGMPGLGKVIAVVFALLCIGGSLAGGNSFQVNQSMNAIQETFPFFADVPWAYGLLMAGLVGIVILGGIRRIANVADKVVPFMAAMYVLASIVVILTNASLAPDAFARIFSQALAPDAIYGGFVGVIVVGFQRAAFSNEAGAGSAPIAHSAAKTRYPIREGTVALLEPFIDTVIICTMTALVLNITGAYNNPAYGDVIATAQGAALTSRAFGEHITWFPFVLSLAVFLFAFSTMISWSYYGERCTVWLFGERASTSYKLLFLVFTFLGSIITAINVLNFGDLMILGMALPNLIGVYLLHGKVKRALDEYWKKYKAGEFLVFEK